jgi:hypothetical protein
MGRLAWLEQTSILDIFKTVTYAEGEKKLAWDLPGHGRAYLDCGEILVKGCVHAEDHPTGKGFGRKFVRSCARKACPTCYEAWGSKEAMRALIRFATYLSNCEEVERLIFRLKHEKRKEPRSKILEAISDELEKIVQLNRIKIKHVVVSPPQDVGWTVRSNYEKSRSKAYQVARSRGIQGGCAVPHPYRLKCAECGHKPIPDYKKECPECGNSRFEWYYAPHFHFVAFGYVHNTKEGYDKDGWVVKNCGVRLSVFWTLQYLLSHAGVSSSHVVTWFGSMAYNHMRAPKLGEIKEHCPWCDRILEPLLWIGGQDRPPPGLTFVKHDATANDFNFEADEWGRAVSVGIEKPLKYA